MTASLARSGLLGALDRVAIGVSGLCLVHCLATSVLVALASTAGGMLVHPVIHEVGLGLAVLLGAVALGRGALRHEMWMPLAMGSLGLGVMAGAITLHGSGEHLEALWTIVGVSLLAFGHRLNRLALE